MTTQPHDEKQFSLTPRFIAVKLTKLAPGNGFNRLPSRAEETVETVGEVVQTACTAMNRGVNESGSRRT